MFDELGMPVANHSHACRLACAQNFTMLSNRTVSFPRAPALIVTIESPCTRVCISSFLLRIDVPRVCQEIRAKSAESSDMASLQCTRLSQLAFRSFHSALCRLAPYPALVALHKRLLPLTRTARPPHFSRGGLPRLALRTATLKGRATITIITMTRGATVTEDLLFDEARTRFTSAARRSRTSSSRRSTMERTWYVLSGALELRDSLKRPFEQKLPAWTVALIALVLLAAIAGLAYYAYSHDWYADVKDFVTFPGEQRAATQSHALTIRHSAELKTPLDPESIFNEATKAVVSVATQIATGAVSVGTQIATGAVEAANDVKDGAEDAANKVKGE